MTSSTGARFSRSVYAHFLMSLRSYPGVWDGVHGKGANRDHCSSRELSFGQSWFSILVFSIALHAVVYPAHAQSINGTLTDQQALNQEIFFQAFSGLNNTKVRTAIAVTANITRNLTDQSVEEVSMVRLRAGSLRRYGYRFNEITLPIGVKVMEPVRSVILVYRKFKDYRYYNVTGVLTQVAPVVGIMVYDAANLSDYANYREELTIMALESPIQVELATPRNTDENRVTCVMYNNTNYRTQSGTVQNRTSQNSSQNSCLWTMVGDYSLLGPRTKGKSNTGKIVAGSVVGGVVFLGLLLFTLWLLLRYRNKSKFKKMQSKSDEGDTLQDARVGSSRAPVAGSTRTKGKLEKSLS